MHSLTGIYKRTYPAKWPNLLHVSKFFTFLWHELSVKIRVLNFKKLAACVLLRTQEFQIVDMDNLLQVKMTLGKFWAEVVQNQLKDILLARVNRLTSVVELINNVNDELSKTFALEIWNFFCDLDICDAGLFFIEWKCSNYLCTPDVVGSFLEQDSSLALWPDTHRLYLVERWVHYCMFFS